MRYGANYSFFTVFLSWEKEVDVGLFYYKYSTNEFGQILRVCVQITKSCTGRRKHVLEGCMRAESTDCMLMCTECTCSSCFEWDNYRTGLTEKNSMFFCSYKSSLCLLIFIRFATDLQRCSYFFVQKDKDRDSVLLCPFSVWSRPSSDQRQRGSCPNQREPHL